MLDHARTVTTGIVRFIAAGFRREIMFIAYECTGVEGRMRSPTITKGSAENRNTQSGVVSEDLISHRCLETGVGFPFSTKSSSSLFRVAVSHRKIMIPHSDHIVMFIICSTVLARLRLEGESENSGI